MPVIKEAVEAITPELERLYQEFHARPELSMMEHGTAEAIASQLRFWGIESFRCGGTGLVAVIENGPGPVVAYRADIDGLPIAEQTGLAYSSTVRSTLPDGTDVPVMHGCGHDCHIVIALGLAWSLKELRSKWAGTTVIIFQPGEETSEGAAAMLADGLWKKAPRPTAIYGQHVWPLPIGEVAVPIGAAMSMADALRVTAHGRQAHGSQPERAIDPIVQGAFMVTRLQAILSRELASSEMAVLTVGTFHGGLKENIIPDSAQFTINLRTIDGSVRKALLKAIERVVHAEAQASGAPKPTVEHMYSFPPCINDRELATALVADLNRDVEHLEVTTPGPVTGSEDFGRLGDEAHIPYVYWFLGCYSPKTLAGQEPVPGNHSPYFAPDSIPDVLRTGTRAALVALLRHVGVR